MERRVYNAQADSRLDGLELTDMNLMRLAGRGSSEAKVIRLPGMSERTDSGLLHSTESLRQRIGNGQDAETYLAEALGAIYEAARRARGVTVTASQLVAAAAVHTGGVAQLPDGSGKGVTAIAVAYLAVLAGRKVHVVTLDDFLAARDFERAQAILSRLGVDTRLVCDAGLLGERRNRYGDVTYGSYRR